MGVDLTVSRHEIGLPTQKSQWTEIVNLLYKVF